MKTTVIDPKSCPNCGRPLPAVALAGLCPQCLLAQGGDTDSGESVSKRGRFTPPAASAVAALFPQLEILGLLGAGGMGAVYKARQPALDRFVALKILPASTGAGAGFEERFNREARALARLHHPNIVTVHEFGLAGDLHYFIMEFVDGANLRQLEEAGRLSPREALQIIPQICDALQYAHDEGVVHRDIKPENVLVDRKGRVRIADFGLAKILGTDPGTSRLTAEGQVMGTPHYMAPEQVERPLTVDHRADIYSLGVVLYEMLTGDLPLGNFSPPSRKVQVDVRFDQVVLRALENDPARRYQHASEVKSQVETIADHPVNPGTAKTARSPIAAEAKPAATQLRWAGFPLVNETGGIRTVNRREAIKAVAIMLGVITIPFGLVSLMTGQTYFGWLGISGGLSLQVRLLVAMLVVAWGVWRAYRSVPSARRFTLPRTPQGTVILAPERFSRKAILGVVWAPLFLVAALMWLQLSQADPEAAVSWWQTLLKYTVLPLGLAAPLGSTLLGWRAVADIRGGNGRLSGLGLAVFDGLCFPVLGLDGFLVWLWLQGLQWMRTQSAVDFFLSGPPLGFVVAGAIGLCSIVDVYVIRRVWRAVRTDGTGTLGGEGDWWWNRRRGAATIALLCAALIAAVAGRLPPGPGLFKNPPNQVAKKDSKTGSLMAKLPGGGSVELLALADIGAAADGWWRPDGSSVAPSLIEVQTPGVLSVPDAVGKDLVFRFAHLENAGREAPYLLLECVPASGYSTGNGVQLNGQKLDRAMPVRMAWPKSVSAATLRLGVSLAAWRTVAISDRNRQSVSSTHQAGDPRTPVYFHEASERDGRTQLTIVRGTGDGKWQTRIIAVDTNGVEHLQSRGAGTPSESNETWTYTFDVPLKQVSEFQAQIRPLHWVEFRDVSLRSLAPARRSLLPPRAQVRVAAPDPRTGGLVGKLLPRGSIELLAVADFGAAPNAWWSPAGEALPESIYEATHFDRYSQPGRTNKSLIVRWRDLPQDAEGPVLEFESGSGGGGNGELLRDGKPLRSSRLVQGLFPITATQACLRVGFALGLWQMISTFDANGTSSMMTLLPEVPKLHGRIHQISEENGQVVVTLIREREDLDWNVRLMAVDTNGVEHGIYTGTSTTAEKTVIWTYRFALKRAQLKEFQVQVRPVHWVEFRDVALQPRDRNALGLSGRSLKKTAFGGVRELHVTELFDFDNGKSGEFPIAADGTKTYRGIARNPSWMRARGFDADARTNALELVGMQIIDLKADEWDKLAVPEFEERLRVYYGPGRLPSDAKAALPVTHGFRTADGAMGMLQILGFDGDKAGVQLRYKLVERAHFE